jgi:chromate transporter
MQEVLKSDAAKSRVSLLISLFMVFLKIGAFTWGGGYGMLPLIKCEVVDKRKWLTSEAFLDGVAVAESVPGAIAVNSATFVGNKVVGTAGALVAALGAVLPSYVALILVATFFLSLRELAPVQNFFKGAVPAVVALLVNAVIDIGKEALRRYTGVIIAAALLILLVFFHVHPILVIVVAGILGLFSGERK